MRKINVGVIGCGNIFNGGRHQANGERVHQVLKLTNGHHNSSGTDRHYEVQSNSFTKNISKNGRSYE